MNNDTYDDGPICIMVDCGGDAVGGDMVGDCFRCDDVGENPARGLKFFLSGAEFGRGDKKLPDLESSGLSSRAADGDAGSDGSAGDVGGSILLGPFL